MNKVKFYRNLAMSGGFVGAGMLLGYSLSEGTSNTPLWIGGILILLSVLLLGMSLGQGKSDSPADKEE